jgi:SAM-dependent methyltransferase
VIRQPREPRAIAKPLRDAVVEIELAFLRERQRCRRHQALADARERLARDHNVRYAQGDACALPFPAGSFDAVLLVLVLGEVSDRARCIDEVARVLKHGGCLTLAETRRDSDSIPFAELRRLVETHCFALEERRGLPWEYTARFRRA